MLETFRCRLQIHGWKENLECLVQKQSLEKAPRSPREAIRPQLALEPGTPKEYFRMAQSGSKRHRKTESKIPLRPVCTFLKGLLALSSGDLTLHLRVLQTEGTAPLDPHVTITNRFSLAGSPIPGMVLFPWLPFCLPTEGWLLCLPASPGGRETSHRPPLMEKKWLSPRFFTP